MNRRILFVALAGLIFACVAVATRGGSTVIVSKAVQNNIDLIASVNNVNVDSTWSQNNRVTSGGAVRLTLDDLRVFTIPDGTMVDNYSSLPPCTDFTTPNACVFLADMLGDAVVWFALIPADKSNDLKFLTLPGLIDMQDNGNEGVLKNNWVVPLATPVKRLCPDAETATLRDFINRFPDTKSTSVVNLVTDSIVSVTCVK